MDENDAIEPDERIITAEEIKKRVEELKQKQEKYEQYKKTMQESGENLSACLGI